MTYLKIARITFEMKRKIKSEESNWRKREASGRNVQVEEREEGEEERQVDTGGEVQRESRCKIEERGGGPFGLVLALGQFSVNNPAYLPLEILLIL